MARPPTTRLAILQLLRQRGAMTASELAAALGQSTHGLRTTLASLQAAQPQALHITAWRRSLGSGPWAAVWAAGPGADAPVPQPLTRAQLQRNHRRRRREACAAAQARALAAREPLTALAHLAWTVTRPALRTPTELLRALRRGLQAG